MCETKICIWEFLRFGLIEKALFQVILGRYSDILRQENAHYC